MGERGLVIWAEIFRWCDFGLTNHNRMNKHSDGWKFFTNENCHIKNFKQPRQQQRKLMRTTKGFE